MILRLLIKVKVKVTLRGNLLFLQFDCRILPPGLFLFQSLFLKYHFSMLTSGNAFFSRTNFLKVVHWVPAKGLVHFSAQTGGAADTWLCQSSSLPSSSSSLWLSSTSLPSHHHHNHEHRCHQYHFHRHHISTMVVVPPRQERHHDHDPHHKIHVQFCGWLPRFAKGCI